MSPSPAVSLRARFGFGVVLPHVALIVFLLVLILVGGKGKEFAPVLALILAFVAVPMTVLINCWVLFVDWKGVASSFLAGLIVPALTGLAFALFMMPLGSDRDAGTVLLAPFALVTQAAGRYPLAAACAWVLALAALLLAARARTRRPQQ
jgi:hypothetical protein